MKILYILPFVLLVNTLLALTPTETRKVSEYLQDISVTIKSHGKYSRSEGSGILITRTIGKEKVTFVWTCGHVIDNLRSVRTVIKGGTQKKIVEFDDVQIVKELVESGRRVGEIKMDAVVVKYSDPDDGEDLAVLMVRARDYGKGSGRFYLDSKEPIIPIGTPLFHVGSLLGQMGANSMTSGIVSQVGRIHGKAEYDQTTVTAFPGSSGGGVFLQTGEYVGMIVRGAGEGFNLMVPIRRMKKWAKEHDIMWALDPKVKMPSMADIEKLPVETISADDESSKKKKNGGKSLPYLIKIVPNKIHETTTIEHK
jgi:hypothetical protein